MSIEDLLDTRAGLALANAAYSEGAADMLKACNRAGPGQVFNKPVSPYSAPLLKMIKVGTEPEAAPDLEKRVATAVGRVVANVFNWPDAVAPHMLGRDLAEPIALIAAALAPVIDEARAEALEQYVDSIERIDEVIRGDEPRDDNWLNYLDSEGEFRDYKPETPKSEMSSAVYYAKFRAKQIRRNDE